MIAYPLYLIWVGLPVLAWIGNLLTGKRIHSAILFVLICFIGYAILLAGVWAIDAELEAKLDSFDLDGDGSFSGAELTPAAERAMSEWASDTGRTFAPFIAIPVTGIWYTFLFGVVFVGEWLFRRCFIRKFSGLDLKNTPSSSKPNPTDDTNPYQSPRQ